MGHKKLDMTEQLSLTHYLFLKVFKNDTTICLLVFVEVKVSTSNEGDAGSIPGLERSPGEGNGNPLQYACLENPMVRGAW